MKTEASPASPTATVPENTGPGWAATPTCGPHRCGPPADIGTAPQVRTPRPHNAAETAQDPFALWIVAAHTRRLLATSTDRHTRDRALDALGSRGHDVSALENPDDVEARETYARSRAERENPGDWDSYADEPPF
ncbi:hypothetical protein [Embleya sp. NPDC059259]|uniref:hypothetical protein n=1 Tax=unclassified Embleya TaxID=2699296 RepID=UPI0036A1CC79